MAEWKKVIVSGSVAELAAVSASTGIDVDGRVAATEFYGDGSNLTNVPAGSINIEAFTDGTSITVNAAQDKLILSDNGTEKQITVSQLFDSSDFDTEVAANSAVTANTAKVSADGNVTSHSDVSSAGSGAIITTSERNKLNAIEASADVTDATNVAAAGALMDSEVTALALIKGLTATTISGSVTSVSSSASSLRSTDRALINTNSAKVSADGNVTTHSDVTSAGSGAIITTSERNKLNAIEASADVTDTANVTSAGALMDSEVTSLALIKGLTATTISGSVTSVSSSASALRTTDRGLINTNTAKTGVSTSTVRTAGALMDDEITNLAQVKAFDSEDYLAAGTTTISGAQASAITANTAKVSATTANIVTALNADLGGNFTIGNQSSDTATFTGGVTVSGNLNVNGTTTTVNTDNLNVKDQFINLNDGGSANDGGLVVEGAGVSFGWDNSATRWGFDAAGATEGQTSITTDAFAVAAVTSDVAAYRKNGNIRVESDEIYIYVE